MKLGKLLKQKENILYKIDADKSVFDAVALLNNHKIGSLLVMNSDKKLEGILTERDILYKCLNSTKNNKETKVADIMTPKEKLIIGTVDDTISYAMKVMTNHRIRHLPIVNKEKVIGLLSIGDIIKTVLEQS